MQFHKQTLAFSELSQVRIHTSISLDWLRAAAAQLRAILARLRRQRAQARADRLARDQLASMSDRELADIGLNHGSIPSAFVRSHDPMIGAYGYDVGGHLRTRR